MRQIVTRGIVLTRTDFQEADRILTILTPDHGKVSVLAKGVRRQKSKLAGGIELLSVSDITYMPGRGELATLVSTRLLNHYGHIVKDINRTLQAYDFLKRVHRITEQAAEPAYFHILQAAMAGLDKLDLPQPLVELWFDMQLLKVTGHTPNLQTDTGGAKLEAGMTYMFDIDMMGFTPHDNGQHPANLIKMLRLAFATDSPLVLGNVQTDAELIKTASNLAKSLTQNALGF